ncbi:hypothetical protein SLS62_000910 [Diatrype stigma]|uniref:Uncharacterized protein n=1 Tax=Diatrype stigma TaxID=117547 RepID=A0AAN9UWM2_9PEZI
MAQNLPADKRRVYLAGRAIFTGDKALLRQLKKVRKVITDNKGVLRPLIRDLGEEKVVEIVRDLLERRVFETELRAKIEFPELFHSSPNQEIQREASEVDAARSVSEAINEIASVEDGEVDTDEEPGEATDVVDGNNGGLGATNSSKSPERPALLPNLYPIYIPYKAQHLILNEAQRLLEESCFEFFQKWLPSVLEENGWECASSIELTRSTQLIAQHAAMIPEEAFVNLPAAAAAAAAAGPGGSGKPAPLAKILSATNGLRHSAVHRLPNTARGVRDLCRSGWALAGRLGDGARAARLDAVCRELDHKVEAMRLNKNALEGAAAAGLEDIRRRREELDRRERDIVARMLREDRENKAAMGVLLESSVARILAERLPDIDEVVEEEGDDDNEIDDGVDVEGAPLLVQGAESFDARGRDGTKEEPRLWNASWHPAWRKD